MATSIVTAHAAAVPTTSRVVLVMDGQEFTERDLRDDVYFTINRMVDTLARVERAIAAQEARERHVAALVH